ncbi:MAG TPA: ATP-binding protein [Ktedonobacteraceae bacterium]|nr:ATP-binding protein [Ktedonobacteraceae bacterium]
MERLNDILGRIPQHRQQKMEHDDPSLQGQEISPSRYSTREQTSHSGLGSRSSQTHYQHKIPQRVRYEQGKYSQQDAYSAYSRQQSPARGISYQQGLKHQVDIDGHTQHEEDFVPGRDRSRGSTGITSADSVDVYSTMAGSDVREEWDDDTGDMLYGDWEDDGNDTNLRFNPQVVGTAVHERNSIYPAPARDTQTYHESNRSFVTRDLPRASNEDSRSQTRHHPGDYYIQSVQHGPNQPTSQEVQRPIRMTQPLKPQSIARPNQEGAQEGSHAQTSIPQLESREQVQHNTAQHTCPICKGAGYLRADVPYGHPSFGKPIACECKEAERKAKRRQQLQEMSDLGAFYDKSFRNFNVHIPGIQEAYNCASEFAQDPNGWLLLIGPNGSGKTHLAAAIANKSLEDGALVLFATVPDLLDHLRAAFAPTSNEVYDQLFSRMREAEVLVLDDLGAQQSSPWANEKLFQLLNYRYNSRFPTVITANSRGLQGIDERIRSRLTDASLVTTVIMDRAKDFRPNNPRRASGY